MDALGEESIREMEGSTQAALLRSERESREVVNFLVGAAIVASGLGLAIAIWLTGAITGPLNSLSAAANRIATGDLTVDLPVVGRRDETGALVQSLATMVGSLREIMKQVREGIGVLGASAGEITAATSQVAAGSAESATAVSQTTATVEEVKQTAHISAQKAKHVSDASQRSAQTSLDGKSAMNESIDAMHRIQKQMGLVAESIVKLSEQSEAIGEILSTVNEFAEQSNLLAVNAAIEAAKAGDQGRGFAVVAQEIKSLSEQSKQATAQVRTILGDIQKATSGAVLATEQGSNAVDAGVKLYGEVGNSIRTMAESIVESSQAASQIASSAQQQLIGMDQVAMAMQNINQASAQNLQSTRRAEAAARDLQDLGRTLTQLVAQFRI
jgi:methyl-accepting chemotaxis protein